MLPICRLFAKRRVGADWKDKMIKSRRGGGRIKNYSKKYKPTKQKVKEHSTPTGVSLFWDKTMDDEDCGTRCEQGASAKELPPCG